MANLKEKAVSLGLIRDQNSSFYQYLDLGDGKSIFSYDPGVSSSSRRTFREQAIITANEIREKTKDKIVILAGGGMDSEVVIKAFLLAGIEFSIVALDLMGINNEELEHLDKFCRDHQLKYQKIHIDVLKFWENDLLSFSEISQSISPQINALLYGAALVDGFIVMGDGEIAIQRKDGIFKEIWKESQNFSEWFLKSERPSCPSFFSYSADLELSIYGDPIVVDFVNAGWIHLDSSHFDYARPFLYYHHFGTRMRYKTNMFDLVSDAENEARNLLAKELKFKNSKCSIEYGAFVDCLKGESSSSLLNRNLLEFSDGAWLSLVRNN